MSVFRCLCVCLLLTSLPVVAWAASCNITGFWHNRLGSVIYLAESDGGLTLGGHYMTAVEVVKGEAGPERQAEVIGIRNRGKNPTFSFSVAWAAGSTTSWVGQCFVQEDGLEVLKTMWLLRSAMMSPQENWAAMRIGEDTFHRSPGNVVSEQPRASE